MKKADLRNVFYICMIALLGYYFKQLTPFIQLMRVFVLNVNPLGL